MDAAGVRDLDVDDLVKCFDRGVTVDLVLALRELGIEDLDVDDLSHASDHGVTPDFIRSLRDLHLEDLELDHLVEMVDNDITADELRSAHAANPDLDADDLVELVKEGQPGASKKGKHSKSKFHLHIH
jgi:hypothetical protein